MDRTYQRELTVSDKLFGQTALADGQATVIKQTYVFLGMSVGAAMAGGFIGANTPAIINLFTGWIGWVLAMVVLNVAPMIAMGARHNPVLGFCALLADGFLSGLVLAPVLAIATVIAPQIIPAALLITAMTFAGVTLYVMTTRRVFSAPRGLMVGMFFAIMGAAVLNAFLNIGPLGFLISLGIGVFGVFTLVFATSAVLNSPEADSPIPGALMLFAGVFNVFVAALHILLRLAGGRRD